MIAWPWECTPVVALAVCALLCTRGGSWRVHDLRDELGLRCQADITGGERGSAAGDRAFVAVQPSDQNVLCRPPAGAARAKESENLTRLTEKATSRTAGRWVPGTSIRTSERR